MSAVGRAVAAVNQTSSSEGFRLLKSRGTDEGVELRHVE